MSLTSLTKKLKRFNRILPQRPWTLSQMGAVWDGPLKEDTPGVTAGANGSSRLFEIDPFDLDEDKYTESQAEDLAVNLMDFVVFVRNNLPEIVDVLEKEALVPRKVEGYGAAPLADGSIQ